VNTADASLYKYLLNCGLKSGALEKEGRQGAPSHLASLRDRSTRAVTILESVELEPKLPSRTDQPHLSHRWGHDVTVTFDSHFSKPFLTTAS